jgi:hypothetical protein
MKPDDLEPLALALAQLDKARADEPSDAAVARLGNLAWGHYYSNLDRATEALERTARLIVGLSQTETEGAQ